MRVEGGEIVLHQHLVHTPRGPVPLTPSERQLLEYLTARPNQVVPLEEILESVWGYAPNSRSQAVHVAIRRLRRKIEVDPARPRHLKTVAGAGWRFEPLQAESPALLGRELDRQRLDVALSEAHRVCITGPPGVGKTALARTVGRGPVVELGAADSLDQALVLVARGLGCDVDQLADRLAATPSVVVLDQVEQLAGPLGDWLDAAPASFRCLLTSRLPVRRTRRVAVGPLAPDAARELFHRRAADLGRDTTGDREAVDALVDFLDRNPLAIELAAARSRVFGPAALLDRIRDNPLPSLVGERSMQATLQWSWDQLGAESRRQLTALSTLAGTFDAETAGALVEEPDRVGVVLDTLLDHGLVQVRGDRFAVLHLVRAFVERAADPADRTAARDRHAAWFARAGSPDGLGALTGPSSTDALIAALPDLRAAASWALARGDRARTAWLCFAWAEAARSVGGTDALVQHVERAPSGDDADATATLWAALGVARTSRGVARDAVAAFRQAAEVAVDVRLQALIGTYLGPLLAACGSADAGAVAEHALALARASQVPGLVVGALNAAALVAEAADDPIAALGRVDEACGVLEAQGDHPVLRAMLDANRARFLERAGRVAEARAVWASVLPAFDAGNPEAAAIVRNNLAYGLWEDGLDEEAAEMARFALQIHRRHGTRVRQAAPLALLGRIARRAGRVDDARRHLGAALTLARECGQGHTVVGMLAELAALALDLGDPAEAEPLLTEARGRAATAEEREQVARVSARSVAR